MASLCQHEFLPQQGELLGGRRNGPLDRTDFFLCVVVLHGQSIHEVTEPTKPSTASSVCIVIIVMLVMFACVPGKKLPLNCRQDTL